MPNFNWTINLSDILWLIGAASTIIVVIHKADKKAVLLTIHVDNCLQEIKDLKADVKAVIALDRRLAVLESSFKFLLKSYDDLRRGVGKIENDG